MIAARGADTDCGAPDLRRLAERVWMSIDGADGVSIAVENWGRLVSVCAAGVLRDYVGHSVETADTYTATRYSPPHHYYYHYHISRRAKEPLDDVFRDEKTQCLELDPLFVSLH